MSIHGKPDAELEADPRFPSGPWTGYFLQAQFPGKHKMDLNLTFRRGSMTGEGRDWVGDFLVKGQYRLEDGSCYFTKKYISKHDVFYKGYNEGKGIWGKWEIASMGPEFKGGFHIWPEGMPDPTGDQLSTAESLPVEPGEITPIVEEPELIPVGARV